MDGEDVMSKSGPIAAARRGDRQVDRTCSRLRAQALQEVVSVLVRVALPVIVVVVEVRTGRVRKDLDPDGGDRTLADIVLHRLGRDDGPLANEERDIAP